MINNVVLVSGVPQSDSVLHIHVSILFQILFPIRLLQSIEQSSLCYIVGPCWLSILNIVVCVCHSPFAHFLFRLFDFLLLSCMSSLYVLYINPLSNIVCRYFLLFCRLLFHFVGGFFCCAEAF